MKKTPGHVTVQNAYYNYYFVLTGALTWWMVQPALRNPLSCSLKLTKFFFITY